MVLTPYQLIEPLHELRLWYPELEVVPTAPVLARKKASIRCIIVSGSIEDI